MEVMMQDVIDSLNYPEKSSLKVTYESIIVYWPIEHFLIDLSFKITWSLIGIGCFPAHVFN